MRTIADRDQALPPLALTRVIKDRNRTARLHDLREEPGGTAQIRQGGRHAPLTERAVLWTVGAIDDASSGGTNGCQIVRRGLVPLRRGRPVLPAFAGGQLVLADESGLQQRHLELAYDVTPLRRLRGERRYAPIRRVGDQRCPAARRLVRQENRRILGPGDVTLAPPLASPVLAEDRASLRVRLGDFLFREEFLVGEA